MSFKRVRLNDTDLALVSNLFAIAKEAIVRGLPPFEDEKEVINELMIMADVTPRLVKSGLDRLIRAGLVERFISNEVAMIRPTHKARIALFGVGPTTGFPDASRLKFSPDSVTRELDPLDIKQAQRRGSIGGNKGLRRGAESLSFKKLDPPENLSLN